MLFGLCGHHARDSRVNQRASAPEYHKFLVVLIGADWAQYGGRRSSIGDRVASIGDARNPSGRQQRAAASRVSLPDADTWSRAPVFGGSRRYRRSSNTIPTGGSPLDALGNNALQRSDLSR
jgi:hypothetical protein